MSDYPVCGAYYRGDPTLCTREPNHGGLHWSEACSWEDQDSVQPGETRDDLAAAIQRVREACRAGSPGRQRMLASGKLIGWDYAVEYVLQALEGDDDE